VLLCGYKFDLLGCLGFPEVQVDRSFPARKHKQTLIPGNHSPFFVNKYPFYFIFKSEWKLWSSKLTHQKEFRGLTIGPFAPRIPRCPWLPGSPPGPGSPMAPGSPRPPGLPCRQMANCGHYTVWPFTIPSWEQCNLFLYVPNTSKLHNTACV